MQWHSVAVAAICHLGAGYGAPPAETRRIQIVDRKPTASSSAAGCLSTLLGAAGIVTLIAAVPYALLWTLFWSASGSWDFEGNGSLKHWLLVKGSTLDRLGIVAQTERPARYSVRFQEGTFPGWRVVTYESGSLPEQIIATYAGRCNAVGLRVIKREPAGNAVAGQEEASLVCEIEPYLDAQVFAERKVSATVTGISMRVWGSR